MKIYAVIVVWAIVEASYAATLDRMAMPQYLLDLANGKLCSCLPLLMLNIL